jgi:hypothetical protein
LSCCKPVNAALEHTVAALTVHVGRRIARQGSRDFDLLFGQKVGQALLAGLTQNRQVAAVDDPHTQSPRTHHQRPKSVMEFGGTSRQVQRLDVSARQHRQHRFDGGRVHHFGPVGAGAHMAVQATLVALVAQIDLQGVQRFDGESPESRWPSKAGKVGCMKGGSWSRWLDSEFNTLHQIKS